MMQGIMRGMVHWWLFVSCSGFGGAYGMKHLDALSALDRERPMWVQYSRGEQGIDPSGCPKRDCGRPLNLEDRLAFWGQGSG